jgi:ABC-2 type transport system ATP-binding protein
VSALEVRGLCKSFGAREVLRALSFSVAPGEVYGLLGPNGSGKTTAINVVCGLLQSEAGAAEIEGVPVGEATKRLLGFAPQELSLYRDLTGAENLELVGRLYGLPAAARRQRVAELVAQFQLEAHAHTRVGALSGGWQRRVHIAAALVHAPRLLVLDEPTAALDVEARHELWLLLERLHRGGTAILLTTHDLEEAGRLCTRVGIVHHGRVAVEGTLAELRTTIAAQQLAVLDAPDDAALEARALARGWTVRRYAGRPTLWLPRPHRLAEVVEALSGLEVSSVTLVPVGLEHVYLEATAS